MALAGCTPRGLEVYRIQCAVLDRKRGTGRLVPGAQSKDLYPDFSLAFGAQRAL